MSSAMFYIFFSPRQKFYPCQTNFFHLPLIDLQVLLKIGFFFSKMSTGHCSNSLCIKNNKWVFSIFMCLCLYIHTIIITFLPDLFEHFPNFIWNYVSFPLGLLEVILSKSAHTQHTRIHPFLPLISFSLPRLCETRSAHPFLSFRYWLHWAPFSFSPTSTLIL